LRNQLPVQGAPISGLKYNRVSNVINKKLCYVLLKTELLQVISVEEIHEEQLAPPQAVFRNHTISKQ
jgi:hypothetical protein